MALFEFLGTLDSLSFILVLIIFLLFVLSMKKALSIVWNAIWIAGISVIFPIVMNKLFDVNLPSDIDSLISFMILGVGAYFVYLVAKSFYNVLGEIQKFTDRIPKPKPPVPKLPGEKHEEYKPGKKEKELAKREKDLEEREKQVRWMSQLEQSKQKKTKNKDEDYAVLEEEPHKSGHVEPLKEIKHKKKGEKDE